MLTGGGSWITQKYILYIYILQQNGYYRECSLDNIMILHHLNGVKSAICQSLCNVLHSCCGQTSLQAVCFLCAHVYRQFTGEYR